MRLLFATDLHGLPGHLQELAQCVRTYQPQVLLVGGDALPDANPADPAGSQAQFVLTEMRQYFNEIKTQHPVISIAVIFGNHDWLCSYDAMVELEQSNLVQVIRSDHPIGLAGHTFLGYWYAPPSPYPVKDFERLDHRGQTYPFDGGLIWDRKQRKPVPVDPPIHLGREPSIREDLARVPAVDTPDWIFVAHAPPARTDLDILTGIGHVGSEAVKEFILQRQPLLSLHGHIHESPRLSGRFWQSLGRTIAINPGQQDDRLAAVLVDILDEAITLTPLGVEGASGQAAVTLPRDLARRPA
jgi:Icc-related predicted phosphoesterase